jgi:glycosyltransferase involved in cell wall biosynthesis
MAMGIPVITNAGVGDVKEIVTKYDAGVVIEDFSTASMQNAIEKIISTTFDKEKIRKGAEAFYSLEKAWNRIRSVYDKVLGLKW